MNFKVIAHLLSFCDIFAEIVIVEFARFVFMHHRDQFDEVKQLVRMNYEIFVKCDGCKSFESHDDWNVGKCNGVIHEASPKLKDLPFSIEDHMIAICRSTVLDDVPSNIGLVIPRANLIDQRRTIRGLNESNRVKFCDTFNRLIATESGEYEVYSNRGASTTGGFEVCLIDGDRAYFTDTLLDRDEVVVKCGNDILNVVQVEHRDGIVVGTLNRSIDVGNRVERLSSYDRAFIGSPSGVVVISFDQPRMYPSIEFANGDAASLNIGEATFINVQGHHYQIYSSIARHRIPIAGPTRDHQTSYAIEISSNQSKSEIGNKLDSRSDIEIEKSFYSEFHHRCSVQSINASNSMIFIRTSAPLETLKDRSTWQSVLSKLRLQTLHTFKFALFSVSFQLSSIQNRMRH